MNSHDGMFKRLLRAEGQSRSANTVEVFGWLILIEGTIVPELQAARGHLKAVERVPREQLPLVAAADEYLALREKAWRMRADALREASMPALREADRAERASLDAFRRIRSVKGPSTAQKGP